MLASVISITDTIFLVVNNKYTGYLTFENIGRNMVLRYDQRLDLDCRRLGGIAMFIISISSLSSSTSEGDRGFRTRYRGFLLGSKGLIRNAIQKMK
jgi:hypothetical protein